MSNHDKIYSTKLQDKLERSTVVLFVVNCLGGVGGRHSGNRATVLSGQHNDSLVAQRKRITEKRG